jgi:hypothetical protein
VANTVPFRLRVLKSMSDLIATASKDAGYNYDLAGCVFRGRVLFGEDDPVPLVSILEAPVPDEPDPTPAAGTTWKGSWRLMVQGWVDDDRENPTDPAHYLMADVKRVLADHRKLMLMKNNLFGMQGRVLDLTIGAGLVRPAQEHVQELANFLLSVTLVIAENMADPYE